jgi:hypothetical protein
MAGARRCFRRAPLSRISRPVSRVLYGAGQAPHVTTIHLGRRLPGASSNLPGRQDPDTGPAHHRLRADARAVPIRFCSRWGLPCHSGCPECGALLPHRFTLTSSLAGRGGLFSVALSLRFGRACARFPSPDVIRHRMSMEPGLSSRGHLSALPQAVVQPTDLLQVGAFFGQIKQARRMPLTVCARFRWSSGRQCHRRVPGGSGAGRP